MAFGTAPPALLAATVAANEAAPAAITNYTAVVDLSATVTKAEGEAISAALATLQDEVTLLRATVAATLVNLKAAGLMAADV